jgi:hypothetical protein
LLRFARNDGAWFSAGAGDDNLPLMSDVARKKMTVDEFLAWAEGRDGRWELFDGRPIAIDNSKGIGFPAEASGAIVQECRTPPRS